MKNRLIWTIKITASQQRYMFSCDPLQPHHVKPHMAAVVKCKIVEGDYDGLKVKLFIVLVYSMF